MAKSRRSKIGTRSVPPSSLLLIFPQLVHLSKVTKRSRADKDVLIEQIREAAIRYPYIYVFSVTNMRNSLFKQIRGEWATSGKFFFAKNRVMAKALGTDTANAIVEGAESISERLTGEVGLFFSEKGVEAVGTWFEGISAVDYARAGFVATDSIIVPAGPVVTREGRPMPATLESQLRQLGMPTSLKKGVVELAAGDYAVCERGQVLTSEQARLLKLFDIPMAEFRVKLHSVFHDGHLAELA